MVWNLSEQSSGELSGGVLFNLDEFDESTVAGWAAGLRRILAGGVSEPDRDWRLLAGAASPPQERGQEPRHRLVVQARPVPVARGAGQAAGSAGSGGAVRQMT